MLTLYFIFRPLQSWLNLFTIKVSVKNRKSDEKGGNTGKELNEKPKWILKTYRVRAAKK